METNEILKSLPEHYQVNVVVLEGRLLAMTHASARIKVHVSIGKKKKTLQAKTNKTDSPFINDFCTFHYNLPLNVLLDQILVVKVYQISRLIRKLIGSFKVELTTVWNQPNHQFYHKWAVLGDLTKQRREGVRGFLKCDISILSKGKKDVVAPESEEVENENAIEENLLVPFNALKDRHRARIIFSIFRADSFSPRFKDRLASKNILPYVKITYAGYQLKTKVARNKGVPVWNEELTFPDLIPPLCQNILVEMCDRHNAFQRHSIGNTNIEMASLCGEGMNGFLPTFGPSFLYLYNPYKKFDRHRNGSCAQKNFTYSCRLLIAMRTEVSNYAEDVLVRRQKIKKKSLIRTIPPLIESSYFDYKKFILFGVIFDVFFFDKKYIEKNIKIKLTIGPKRDMGEGVKETKKKSNEQQYSNPFDHPKTISVMTKCNSTRNHRAKVMTDYSFIAFSGKFPCVHVYGEWPDAMRKMYRSNIIKKVILNTTNEVNKIKYKLEFEEERRLEYSSEKLKGILSDLSKSCELLLLMTKLMMVEDTNLNRQKKKFYHRELAEMAEKTKLASNKKVLVVEDEITRIAAYVSRLTKYAHDPENSFPDTEIWILRNRKITGHIRIRTEDIAYSSNCPERGIKSGQIQTILIRGKKERIKAKVDILLWFGHECDFLECLKMLPRGYRHKNKPCPAKDSVGIKIPTDLVYEEKHYFTCRVHIFQAKLLIGFDETGLADPFTKIIVSEQTKTTRVQKSTLNPIWNETLIFPLVTLYGPSKDIKKNSMSIIAEVYDKEKAGKELIGRCFIIPAVKLLTEDYDPPDFPPKLKWEEIQNEIFEVGKILMTSELLELEGPKDKRYMDYARSGMTLGMPDDIVPHNERYRLEIMFWGLRQFRRNRTLKNKVFVILECAGKCVKSPILKNVRHKLNFPGIVQVLDLDIPEQREYAPPLTVKLYHVNSATGAKNYMANSIVQNVKYFQHVRGEKTKKEKELHKEIVEEKKEEKEIKVAERINRQLLLQKLENQQEFKEFLALQYAQMVRRIQCLLKKRKCEEDVSYEGEPIDDEPVDWWVKYYAALESPEVYPGVPVIKIYKEELEAQPQFKGFTDFLYTFDMTVGHGKKKNQPPIVVAKVKAILDIYKASEECKPNGHLERAPTNEPIKYVVRAYIVSGINLPPKDIYGKSDPYVVVKLGHQKKSDRKNYVSKQLNPTFGKCFEFTGTFPKETLLRVKVIDYDATSKDDLIGQTTIDLENRYYSRYHASCGLSTNFEKEGANPWRDIFTPKDILKKTCRMYQIKEPVYEKGKVIVGDHTFHTKVPKKTKYVEQVQALEVLHRWYEIPGYGFHFVPEHVETRSLYNPAIPGIEQGKLHMWVDIFPADLRFMPPSVDIKPRSPMPLELRAIVWNVDDVVLDDRTFFFNERMSDIYVKGWILTLEEEMQRTDIHYRSLNGEGSFNWRFIFHFNYIPTERKMVVKKKIDAFDLHPEERKHQCKLEIQIWDNDAFGDDYLGTLILELASMPRGAKLSSRCSLKMLSPNAAKVNLFKIRKTRGWWPFRRLKEKKEVGNEFELTGKIDLELEILTEVEAVLNPAGKGRGEPNALPPPIRPETSFNWFLSPLKTLRYIVLRKFYRIFLWGCLILLLAFFVLMTLYLIPSMILKKIFNIK